MSTPFLWISYAMHLRFAKAKFALGIFCAIYPQLRNLFVSELQNKLKRADWVSRRLSSPSAFLQ